MLLANLIVADIEQQGTDYYGGDGPAEEEGAPDLVAKGEGDELPEDGLLYVFNENPE